jgi:hypothetical protein
MSFLRPYWWTREGGDDEDPRGLASTDTPIRRPADHQPHPRRLAAQPAWVRIAVAVVLVVGVVRLLGSVAAWTSCGADGGQAWVLAIQGLGAKPSALECLGAGLNNTSGPGDSTPAIEPPTTEPPPLVTNPGRLAGAVPQRRRDVPRFAVWEDRLCGWWLHGLWTVPWWRAARLAFRLPGSLAPFTRRARLEHGGGLVAVRAGQLEQSWISTRWLPPPSAY